MEAIVTSSWVDTQPDGSLLVTWELEGGDAAVDLAAGPTPDHLDHRHQITVPAGQTSWRLEPGSTERLFVSIAPHGSGPALVTADRRIAFRGISNFRDLGGYRTELGAGVQWGRIFRADGLHGLLPEDLGVYEQLGLQTVYDLRGDAERDENPSLAGARNLKVVSRPEDGSIPELPAAMTVADGERILAEMYKGVIDHSAKLIGRLFLGLTDPGALPAVFHCHAGKDRTGVVAALLLEALGVDREDILDDYELTTRYRLRSQQESTFQRLLDSGLSLEAAAGVLTTPRWAMEEALVHLDTKYSGIDQYLTGPARMRKEDLGTLRALLLDGGALF